MCGIAGIVSKNKSVSLKDTVISLSQSIKHRGPDGEGFVFISSDTITPASSHETPLVNRESNQYLFNPTKAIAAISNDYEIALAHRRLSIIDLSETGHQPMCDNTGNYWITFNGEIYNYIELKEELTIKGHLFVTHTDTEVLIEAYKEWGFECLRKLNGMFAFVLYDKQQQHLFCARDRVGVKPFYYADTNDAFVFASEYKAFIKAGVVPFEINEKQQVDFLTQATLETTEESLFKGIKELKPAHYLIYHVSEHQLQIKKYYSLPQQSIIQKSDKEIIQLIEAKIINAISLRLRSDVAVGSCLSGGLDSSIIAGVIKHLQPSNQLKLFTATFPSENFDESGYAKKVNDFVNGSWYTTTPQAQEFFRDIEQLNYYQDLPIWSTSTYSQHRVMQLAQEQHIKVVLDGQGADELFGGYTHHYMALWKEQFSFKQLHNAKQTIAKPYKLFAKQFIKEKLKLQVNYSSYFNSPIPSLGYNTENNIASTLNQQLQLDYQGRLKSFLKCEDRCSMAFGIESRVPFADDVELVDLLFSIQGNKKIQQGVSKYLLREATKQFVPKEIYQRRDKIGFETPVEKWLTPNKQQIQEVIITQLDFINKKNLRTNFNNLLQTKPHFVFRLYSLAVWKKVFAEL